MLSRVKFGLTIGVWYLKVSSKSIALASTPSISIPMTAAIYTWTTSLLSTTMGITAYWSLAASSTFQPDGIRSAWNSSTHLEKRF
jgi:hypothetical protein